jgi:DNA-dependent protein kinase catalytic subunit
LDLRYSLLSRGDLEFSKPEDQEFLLRTVSFSRKLFKRLADSFKEWLPQLLEAGIARASDLPHLSALYIFISSVLAAAKQLDVLGADPRLCGRVLNFIVGLAKRQREFHGALQADSLELCISIPPHVLLAVPKASRDWLPCLKKALELGLSHIPLAHAALNALQEWLILAPEEVLKDFLPEVLPVLGTYLAASQEDLHITVAQRAVRLLGSLGGQVHLLVKGETQQLELNWDSEQRISLVLPFHSARVAFALDPLLPRVVELAESSGDRSTRVTACELVHAILLYTLGKNAQAAGRTQIKVTPFAKIYEHLFPAVFRLATDLDAVVRQLFSPLSRQVVRWFAKSKSSEHPETMTLLESLLTAAASQ